MRIIYLTNYIGRETAMIQKREGDIETVPHAFALELLRLGVAKEYIEPQPEKKKAAKNADT